LGNAALSFNAYVAFQIRFSPELKERLIRRSYETGVSQREIVTEALSRYLAKDGNIKGDHSQAIG
jgi:predicted DNA-binding protein